MPSPSAERLLSGGTAPNWGDTVFDRTPDNGMTAAGLRSADLGAGRVDTISFRVPVAKPNTNSGNSVP